MNSLFPIFWSFSDSAMTFFSSLTHHLEILIVLLVCLKRDKRQQSSISLSRELPLHSSPISFPLYTVESAVQKYVGQDVLFVHVCPFSWDDHLVSDESGKNTGEMSLIHSIMKGVRQLIPLPFFVLIAFFLLILKSNLIPSLRPAPLLMMERKSVQWITWLSWKVGCQRFMSLSFAFPLISTFSFSPSPHTDYRVVSQTDTQSLEWTLNQLLLSLLATTRTASEQVSSSYFHFIPFPEQT